MFKPFEIGTESHALHDLTLDNDLDRVSLYGNLQITKDKVGLEAAKALQSYVNAIVDRLEKEASLPDQLASQTENEIENPFL